MATKPNLMLYVIWLLVLVTKIIYGNIDFIETSILQANPIHTLSNYNAELGTITTDIFGAPLGNNGEGEQIPLGHDGEEEEGEQIIIGHDEEEFTPSEADLVFDEIDEEWRNKLASITKEVYERGEFYIYDEVYNNCVVYYNEERDRELRYVLENVSTSYEREKLYKEHMDTYHNEMDSLPNLVDEYIWDLSRGAIESNRGIVADYDLVMGKIAPIIDPTPLWLKLPPIIDATPTIDPNPNWLDLPPIVDPTHVYSSTPVDDTYTDTDTDTDIDVGHALSIAEESVSVSDTDVDIDVGHALTDAEESTTPAPASSSSSTTNNKRNYDEYLDSDTDSNTESGSDKGNKRIKTDSDSDSDSESTDDASEPKDNASESTGDAS
jgi:hypothetical protein